MNKHIYKYQNISCDNIVFTKPIKVSDSKYKIRIFYKDNNHINKLTTVLPTLFCCDPIDGNEIILTLNRKNNEELESLTTFLNNKECKSIKFKSRQYRI